MERRLTSGARTRLSGALAIVCIAASACWAPAALAQIQAAGPSEAPTTVSLHPSVAPERLGAATTLTLSYTFAGGEEGVPAPVSRIVLRLPAGMRVGLAGVATCAVARLRSAGPAGCPSSSLLGRGHAVSAVHAGSQALSEKAALSVFRAPNSHGQATFEIFGHGETPLDQSTISTAILGHAGAPYGPSLSVSIPPIPTVVLEPDASLLTVSLKVGSLGRGRAGRGAIVLPGSCPSGGFPFAATVTFADGAGANANARVPCP